jgi:allantoinase
MSSNILIKNGKVWDCETKSLINADILVIGGKIKKIAKQIDINENFKILDVKQQLVLPGAIDSHVHFNDPGYTNREDFLHGTKAAAKGGITTVIDMPCTSVPEVTSIGNLMRKLEIVEQKAVVDYAFYGGISNNVFNNFEQNIRQLSPFVAGFKTYSVSGMKTFESLDYFQIGKVVRYASNLGKVVLLHAEDSAYINKRKKEVQIESDNPYSYYLSRDEQAEITAVKNAINAVKGYEKFLHIVHIGAGDVVDLIKNTGVTGETAPHYLHFDCNDFAELGSVLKVNPPVKSPKNKQLLWRGLNDGTISFVASDHAPCKRKDKFTGSILTDYSGIPGTETMIPYLFSEGYKKGKISLEKFVQITTLNVAKRYGLFERKGSIELGKDGDFIIIDENDFCTVNQDKLYSKGETTPFNGFKFQGKITYTVVRGKIVYSSDEGITVNPGYGEFLKY